MTTDKLLKKHKVSHIDDFYEIILTEEVEGNRSDVKKLIASMTKDQRKDYTKYLIAVITHPDHSTDFKTDAEAILHIVISSF